jgi:4-amino-4-deoxy-L-arabinose transferase-like glycosyltransferase
MDSRILGIIGGVLLVIGVFCPIYGIEGIGINISYLGGLAGTSWQGLLLILLGIAAIALAVLRKYKLLLVPGLLALIVLAYEFLTYKSQFSEAAGGRIADAENAISIKWGMIVLLLGSLVLLAAGAMGKNLPAPGAAYGAPPPPQPPYTPGR